MKSIMRVEGIDKYFKSGHITVHALKDVAIDVVPGKLTIFKGRSGSGKTTLMNLMGALDKPDNGDIYFYDKDKEKELHITNMAESKRTQFRRNNVGFIFQSVALISMMSAYENVEFGLRISGYKISERRQRAEDCLRFVGLNKRMTHRPAELSGGEQQRVAIARAIAHKPTILFADEPTGELDTHTGLQVMLLFRELVEKDGLTVIMTTHDPNMMELADKVYELEDGVIINE